MTKQFNTRDQLELILNYTQALGRELAQLPDNRAELKRLFNEADPAERAQIDEYLGKLGILFGHLRERFVSLRHGVMQ